VLVGADGRPCIWDPFTRDGAIRFTSPARTLENVPPGAYTLRAGAATREVTVAEGGCTSVVLNWHCAEAAARPCRRHWRIG
jgi:hypothetical protein